MKNNRKLKIAAIIFAALAMVVFLMLFIADFIYYNGINKKLKVELGSNLPAASEFLKNEGEASYITDISKINRKKVGKHRVKIDCNGKEKNVYIIIEDTTTPFVQVKDMDISIYDTVEAKDLIVKLEDESKVKIEYKKKPEFGTVGHYKADILVEDEQGNRTIVTSKVNVCRVKDYVEYKYGSSFPTVENFIFSDKDTGKLITDLEEMVKKPGTYYVTIEIDGKNYKSKLIAIDEEPPVVVSRDAEITIEEIDNKKSLMPNDFIYSFKDADDVTMYFLNTPDYSGKKDIDVQVAVADSSGNTTIINRKLYVVEHKGMDLVLGSGALTNNRLTAGLTCNEATLVSGNVDTDRIGRYPIVVNVDGTQKNIFVNVIDGDAPVAEAVPLTLEKRTDILPSMFVNNIKDSTKVKAEFVEMPDEINRGLQKIKIRLTDEGGNITYIDTTLNILYDAIAPELKGVAGVSTYIRQKPDYMLGVSAVDDVDGNVSVTVDDSKVDYEKAGIYEITYKAKDKSGNNVTTVTNIEVKNVTRELVDSMADEILESITTDSMSITQKALAAYEYIQDNVRYINQADQSSVEKAAYDGLTLGVGDCFTFASLTEVFMERIGGETVFVSRDSDTSNHYWILCNLGTGWYHMDATPRNSTFKCFMKTDAQILAESERYWIYDKTLYPAVATEIYK